MKSSSEWSILYLTRSEERRKRRPSYLNELATAMTAVPPFRPPSLGPRSKQRIRTCDSVTSCDEASRCKKRQGTDGSVPSDRAFGTQLLTNTDGPPGKTQKKDRDTEDLCGPHRASECRDAAMDQAGGCREKAAATGRDTSNKNKTAAGAEAADDACARGPARTCVPRTAYKRGTLSGTFLNRVTVVGGLCPELAFSLNKGFDSVSVDALAADSFALLCRAVTYFGSPGPDGAPRSGGNIVRAMRLDPCLGLLPRHLRELTERSLPSGACISRLFLEEARVNLTKGIKLQNAPGITRASSFDTVGRWQESGRDGTCRSASVRVEVDGAVRTGRLAACVSSGVPLRGCGEKLVVNHAFVQLYRPCDWRGTPLPKTALSWPGQFMAYGAIEGPAGLEPEMVLVPARAVKGRVQVVRRFKSFREDSGAVADDGALYDARLREVDDSWRNWTAERFSVEEARCDT